MRENKVIKKSISSFNLAIMSVNKTYSLKSHKIYLNSKLVTF